MNERKGISLIVLVITILVMIILAGVVVVSLQKNNPIEKAKQARIQTNFKSLIEIMNTHLVTIDAQDKKKSEINYSKEEDLENIFGNAMSEYKNRLEIKEGELYLKKMKDGEEKILDVGGKIIFTSMDNSKFSIRLAHGAYKKGNLIILEPLKSVDGEYTYYPHTFGPYIPLTKGEYMITVKGENLDKLDIELYNNYNRPEPETIRFTVKPIAKTSNEYTFTFAVPKDVKDAEFRFSNKTINSTKDIIKIEDKIFFSKVS